MSLFAFAMPGPVEMAIILGILVLLFGPKMLPKMARDIGSVIPMFKKGLKDAENEISEASDALKETVKDDKS